MVVTERVKRAQTEDELQEVRLEKDALKEALRLIEGENGQLRSAQLSTGGISDRTAHQSSSHSRSSSRDAIKSPPPSSPSPSDSDDIALPSALPPSTASFMTENSDHLADFILQPAPKTTFVVLHQKSPPKEVISNVLNNNSPLAFDFAGQTSFIPGEPSPWADVSP
jgi:hypothetical protein